MFADLLVRQSGMGGSRQLLLSLMGIIATLVACTSCDAPESPPVIREASASPSSIAGPGEVEFVWSTEGAEEVRISIFDTPLPPVGRRTAYVVPPVRVTLVAVNCHGMVHTTIEIGLSAPSQAPARVSGRVERDDGKPIEGASVRIGDSVEAITGSDGRFSLATTTLPFNVMVREPETAGTVTTFWGVASLEPVLSMPSSPLEPPLEAVRVKGVLQGESGPAHSHYTSLNFVSRNGLSGEDLAGDVREFSILHQHRPHEGDASAIVYRALKSKPFSIEGVGALSGLTFAGDVELGTISLTRPQVSHHTLQLCAPGGASSTGTARLWMGREEKHYWYVGTPKAVRDGEQLEDVPHIPDWRRYLSVSLPVDPKDPGGDLFQSQVEILGRTVKMEFPPLPVISFEPGAAQAHDIRIDGAGMVCRLVFSGENGGTHVLVSANGVIPLGAIGLRPGRSYGMTGNCFGPMLDMDAVVSTRRWREATLQRGAFQRASISDRRALTFAE